LLSLNILSVLISATFQFIIAFILFPRIVQNNGDSHNSITKMSKLAFWK